MPTQHSVGIGIIGAGLMGGIHAGVYAALPHTRLVAVTDRDSDRAHKLAIAYGAKSYPTTASLLADPQINAVSICTTDMEHREPSIAAANAGKHILLEKPMATTMDDADAILNAARREGIILMVGHNCRFFRPFYEAQKAFRMRRVGDLLSLYAHHQVAPGVQNRLKGQNLSVRVFRGVHDFDLLRWYANSDVVRVYSESVVSDNGSGSEDTTWTLLRFANGAVGCVEVGSLCRREMCADYKMSICVTGTEGQLDAAIPEMEYTLHANDQHRISHTDDYVYRDEIQHFVKCVIEGEQPLVTGEDGRAALAIAVAATESAKTGRAIQLHPVRSS